MLALETIGPTEKYLVRINGEGRSQLIAATAVAAAQIGHAKRAAHHEALQEAAAA